MSNKSHRQGLAELLSGVASQATWRLSELLEAQGGLRLEEWRVLQLLSDGEGHAMADVAQAVRLPAPTVTRLVDRMVADNRVYRRADDQDRRRLLVYSTVRGQRQYADLEPLIAAYENELLGVVGDDGDVMMEVLERLWQEL